MQLKAAKAGWQANLLLSILPNYTQKQYKTAKNKNKTNPSSPSVLIPLIQSRNKKARTFCPGFYI